MSFPSGFKVNPKLAMLTILPFVGLSSAFADPTEHVVPAKTIVGQDTKHDISMPLRFMQPSTQQNIGFQERNLYPASSIKAILEQRHLPPTQVEDASLLPLNGFQGLGVGLGDYLPTSAAPDINMSVSFTQIMQWVTNDFAVFDKAGNLAPGFPKKGSALWAGFGGTCEHGITGWFTVKYDQLAHRWVLGQFASDNLVMGPFYYCMAVSTTSDATGSYYRYAFPVDSFSSYSRVALWPDAYYLSLYMSGRVSYGPQVCALQRDKMIKGEAASIQCKQLTLDQAGTILPADLEGDELPLAGNPEYFIGLDEPSALMLYKYHVDWNDPLLSELTSLSLPVAPYTKACSSTNGANCAIQPNTENRLTIPVNRVMTRLAFRKFPDHASMVTNQTVEGPRPKFAPAIRWYEFRVPDTTTSFNPVIFQQSTIAPDSKHRYLGSTAIDRFGNIATGYNVSSSLIFPSLELAYHNYNTPLNSVVIQPLVTGRGSQVNGVSNWSISSKMVVDPSDQCTFWYTNEYLRTNGSFNWSTFIIKMKLAACA